MLTVGQAARILNVSMATIWRRLKDGTIPAVRIGNSGPVRIPRSALDELLELSRYEPSQAA